MFVRNGRRFNLDAYLGSVWIDDEGTQHPGVLLRDPDFRAQHGIEEIEDPPRGNDETEYTQEIDVPPYIVITPKSPEQIEQAISARLTTAVQAHLDAEAQLKGYDNILSACSYASVVNPFQQEAISFLNWRSACWEYCYQLLADIKAGTKAIPTSKDLISSLPARIF